MGVIDVDAHVIETERTWSFMLEQDQRFAPELPVSNKSGVEFWRIDDRVFPNSNLGLNVPEDARDLTAVHSRFAHMDALGIAYVVEYASEDNLIVGTDYGHADYSNDIEAIQTLAQGGKISPSLAQKILVDNPKRLYGL